MQISKTLFLLCAAATIALQPVALAVDNEAQAKARKALEQVMQGQQTGAVPVPVQPSAPVQPPAAAQPPAIVAPPAPPAPPAATPAAQTPVRQPKPDSAAIAKAREAVRARIGQLDASQAPAVQPPTAQPPAVQAPAVQPPTVQPATQPPVAQPPAVATTEVPKQSAPQAATDPEEIRKAREALQQKMIELESQPPGTTTAQPPEPRPKTAKQRTKAPEAPPQSFSDVTSTQSDAAKIEQAREAVRQKQQALSEETSPKAPAQKPVAEKQPKAEKPVAEKQPKAIAEKAAPQQRKPATAQATAQGQPTRQYKPLAAPPVPFSKEQQDKLAELLRRYRADEITPEQYHAERSKIVSAP